jgi:DNA-binding MarR family transcriptional regulator
MRLADHRHVAEHEVVGGRGGSPTTARLPALDRLADLDPMSSSWEPELSAITLDFVDALLEADVDALEQAADPLRDELARLFDDQGHVREIRGWLLALLALTRWGVQRLPATAELELAQNTQAWRFLTALGRSQPLGSSELREQLGTSDSQVSRVGRDLIARGLVVQRRLGRHAHWELTPRGRKLLKTGDANNPGHGRAHARAASVDVLPDDRGTGWRVAEKPGGRTVGHATSKASAVRRATKMVKESGGGDVRVHNTSGGVRTISVDRSD